MTWDTLGGDTEFDSFDNKLATAVCTIANQRLQTRMNLLDTQMERTYKRLRGRHMLRMFYEQYSMEQAGGQHFRFEELVGVTLHGSDAAHLEKFLNKWDDCLASLEQTLPDDALLALFQTPIDESKSTSRGSFAF